MASHCLAWGLGIYPSAMVRTIWKSNSIKPQVMEVEATWLYLEGLRSGCVSWRMAPRRHLAMEAPIGVPPLIRFT